MNRLSKLVLGLSAGVLILAVCVTPAYADLVYVDTVDHLGSGIGSQFTIINAKLTGSSGTVEDADLTFDSNGADDPTENNDDTQITGGANNQSWNLANDLGITDASQLRLVLNIDEEGTDDAINLTRLTLWVWNAVGEHLDHFDLASSDVGIYEASTGSGIGAQGFVFKLDDGQVADLNAIINAVGVGPENIRIGAGFAADSVSAGFETLNVAKAATSVPEPLTLIFLGTGLLGVGIVRRRRS